MRTPDRAAFESLTRRDFLAGLIGAALTTSVSATALADSSFAFATIVGSPIACGRLRGIDTTEAEKLPGVSIVRVKSDDELAYEGEPLLLILAARRDAAEEAARRCRVLYESRPAIVTTAAALPSAYQPEAASPLCELRGDPDGAIGELQLTAGASLTVVKQTYRTAAEPLFLDVPSPRVTSLSSLAEQKAQRKVELLLSPAQIQSLGGQRPETLQTLTLGATRDGRLRALTHNAVNDTAMHDEYIEPCTLLSRHLYQTETLRLSHKLVRKNVAPRGSRELIAPGLLPGLFALEQAIDELAFALRIDPLRMRRLHDTDVDTLSKKQWARKQLRECYRVGEEAIGWTSRKLEPRAQKNGDTFIGLGMASTMGPPRVVGDEALAPWGAHFCRVAVSASGEVTVARLVTVLDVGATGKALTTAAEAGVSHALKTLFVGPGRATATSELKMTLLESEDVGPRTLWTPQTVRDVAAAGVAAAVANALHNATGRRYRELPIRPVEVIG